MGVEAGLASHLLGEIERVCTYLVAIDAGKLLQAAPLKSFTEHTGHVQRWPHVSVPTHFAFAPSA